MTAPLLAIFALLLAAPPERVEDLLRQAEGKIDAAQFPEAQALLERALRQNPSHTEVLYRLGYVAYRQRSLSAARRHFSAVLQDAPPALNSRYFLGRIALLENKPAEAIKWLEPVAASGASIYDADSQLAAAYAAAGRPSKAAAALKAAIARTPWDGALYYRLGQILKASNEKELADEAFRTSARLKAATREDVEILMRVGALLSEHKAAEAFEAGAKIEDRADPDPEALIALGVLYANSNQPAKALSAFGRASALSKNSFQAQFNHGLALLKLGRPEEALTPLTAAVELLPQSIDAAMTLGLAAVMCRRYEGAVAPLEMARQRDPANPKLATLLGTAYLRTNEPKKAVTLLRDARVAAADATPSLLLIEALNATEATGEALEEARQAQKRFPDSPQCHMAAAQQLMRLGRYQDASAAFERVLVLAPGQPEAELGLADTLQKTGRHQEAVSHYRASGQSLAATLGQARSLTALRKLDEARQILEAEVGRNPSDALLHQELSRIFGRLGLSEQAAEHARIAENLRTR